MAATGNPRARLEHILFHIQGVKDTIGDNDLAAFKSVYHFERTVERAVQIISEAVKSLPSEMLMRYPEIEWNKIMAIGNVLRHEYQRIDPDAMWDIAIVKLPELEQVIRRMLAGLK